MRRAYPRLLIFVFLLSLLPPVVAETRGIDLVELYSRASEFDPTLQVARYTWQATQEDLRLARSGTRPTVTVSGDASKTYQNIKSSDNSLFSEGRTDFLNTNYDVSVSQPLYRPDVLGRITQARTDVSRSVLEVSAEEQDLIFRLAQAFFGFLSARDNLEFTTAERMANERQLEESEQRFSSGLGVISVVHEARARYALTQAAEIVAADRLEEARLAIIEITGELPSDPLVLSESYPLLKPEPADVDVWIESARFQNPRVKALEIAVERAEREIRLQRAAGRMPALDLVASYGNRDNGGTEFGGGSETVTSSATLRLTVPLYDGGASAAGVRNSVLQHKIALMGLERARRRIELETRSAFQGVMGGIARIEALRQSVFSQEAALISLEEGIRAGLTTGLDVLNARRDLFSARRDLAEARYEYILSGLNLKRWTGALTVDDLREINAYLQ